jgi:hypothetical protein
MEAAKPEGAGAGFVFYSPCAAGIVEILYSVENTPKGERSVVFAAGIAGFFSNGD